MALKIIEVRNGNKPEEELVLLQATNDINTKGYAIVDKTFDSEGNHSNEFRHIYLFPNVEVKKGEAIIVFTGKGKDGIKAHKDKKYLALFWNADHCVWNAGGDTATLIRYDVQQSFAVPSKSK